jgi:signal recognition particle receptor subunit beta
MASLNPLTREVVFKVVFYGPGLGGKTTTLQYIHAATKPEHRGKMVSLATPMDRTLYFDFLPLRIPRVRGMSVRLQLFTVPGQVYYGATRKLVLTGADGIVFVADSQLGREDANRESLEDLITNLADHNRALVSVPHTFHWNKRDIGDVVPIEDLDRTFNPHGAPSLGTVATRGAGVFEGLERIMRLVMRAYEAELPRNDATPGSMRADSDEAGIADAIRGLAESPYKPRVTPFAGTRAVRADSPPSGLESIPAPIPRRQSAPDLSAFAPSWGQPASATAASPASGTPAVSSAPSPPPQPTSPAASSVLSAVAAVSPVQAWSPVVTSVAEDISMRTTTVPGDPAHSPIDILPADPGRELRSSQRPTDEPPAPRSPIPRPPLRPDGVDGAAAAAAAATTPPEEGLAGGISFVALWSDSEREAALDVERALGAEDAGAAAMALDVLLTRVLASAAGLAGHADAPRDPAVVPLLLGLDGRRYLAFRALVRGARMGEAVTLRDALDAYVFALEARRAREAMAR